MTEDGYDQYVKEIEAERVCARCRKPFEVHARADHECDGFQAITARLDEVVEELAKQCDATMSVVNKLDAANYCLAGIVDIIERVEVRCQAADGPVTDTREEITIEEFRQIYQLAQGKI